MACGKAVVAASHGGVDEILEDGQTGLLVTPGDPQALSAAVNYLLSEPAKAKAFGRNGRVRVENHFSWSSIAAQTRDLYREVRDEWRTRRSDAAS